MKFWTCGLIDKLAPIRSQRQCPWTSSRMTSQFCYCDKLDGSKKLRVPHSPALPLPQYSRKHTTTNPTSAPIIGYKRLSLHPLVLTAWPSRHAVIELLVRMFSHMPSRRLGLNAWPERLT